jgi:hypothetical protein
MQCEIISGLQDTDSVDRQGYNTNIQAESVQQLIEMLSRRQA